MTINLLILHLPLMMVIAHISIHYILVEIRSIHDIIKVIYGAFNLPVE
jgi:hypothetical protein